MQIIHIVDNSLCNLGSIVRMLSEHNIKVVASSCPEELSRATKLILPGVGHYRSGSSQLSKLGLREVIVNKANQEGIPILGICLGMQLLFNSSDEAMKEHKGLGILKGQCEKLNINRDNIKIPHMGWNDIDVNQKSVLLKGIMNPRFYFLHSYHAVPESNEVIVGTTQYGQTITSVVEKDNVMGTQFHPEKSHKFGKALLENFVLL